MQIAPGFWRLAQRGCGKQPSRILFGNRVHRPVYRATYQHGPGEHAFDKEFGCEIFFLDFESIVSHTRWEGQFSEYITKAITQHEKRLTGVNVRVIIDDTTRQDNVFDAPAVKKRVQVYVYGTLVHTGEKRCFYYVIYLGPISTR